MEQKLTTSTMNPVEKRKTTQAVNTKNSLGMRDYKVILYKLLKNNAVGYKEDLKKLATASMSPEMFDRLWETESVIGVVHNGIDGTFKDRYSVTDFGKRQIVAFIELSDYIKS